jgi:hypothetical protein
VAQAFQVLCLTRLPHSVSDSAGASSLRLPNRENAASTASAWRWQYLCVIVIELCPAIRASVNASQNGAMPVPPDIMVSFFSAKMIDSLVKTEGLTLNSWGRVEVFETVSTHAYNPEFQRHQIVRMGKHLKKLSISPEVLKVLVNSKQQPEQP